MLKTIKTSASKVDPPNNVKSTSVTRYCDGCGKELDPLETTILYQDKIFCENCNPFTN
jgi:hypothetical protein